MLIAHRANEGAFGSAARAKIGFFKRPGKLVDEVSDPIGQWFFGRLVKLSKDAAEVLALWGTEMHG